MPGYRIVDGQPGVEFTIGNSKAEYTAFITGLRDLLACHHDGPREDVLQGHQDEARYPSGHHPVLPPQRCAEEPARWLHIKLKGSKETSTTLVVRDDNLDVRGFMSKKRVWYELSGPDRVGMLPKGRYKNRVLLPWDVSYGSILNGGNSRQALEKLSEKMLNKEFMRNAVKMLSGYHENVDFSTSYRRALVGLMVMVCESAKINPLCRMFEYNWNMFQKHTLTTKHMGYILNWKYLSADLRGWKDRSFAEWTRHRKLQWKEVIDNDADYTAEYVLDIIYLVLNAPRGFDTAPPGPRHPEEIVDTIGDVLEGHPDPEVYSSTGDHPEESARIVDGQPGVQFTIGDNDAEYTAFIMGLRNLLAGHNDGPRVDVLHGHPDPVGYPTGDHPVLPPQRCAEEPARWLHIKLKVSNETSTTLVVRDDNMYVKGFMGQAGVWYELTGKDKVGMLPKDQYNNPVPLPWDVSYGSILRILTNSGKSKEALELLSSEELNMIFVSDAVEQLSGYHQHVKRRYEMLTRLGLGGLIVMVCESTRMNPLHLMFEANWNMFQEHTLTTKHFGIIWNWKNLSADLRDWKKHGFAEWTPLRELQWEEFLDKREDYTEGYVLDVIYLVLNAPLVQGGGPNQAPDQGDGPNGAPGNDRRGGPNRAPGNDQGAPGNDQGGGPNRALGNDQGGGPNQAPGNDQGGGPSRARGNIRGGRRQGRRRVEVLAISVNFHVVSIIVFDGKRGQILYEDRESQEEKGEEGMVDLVLTGPYTGISVDGCFAIKVIDIPTSSGDTDDPIRWQWDGYDQAYAAEVDVPEPVTRTISMDSNPSRNVKVTYMVMSNALEATVEVKLRLKDGHSSNIYGKITACTGDLRVGSVLFSRSQGTAVQFFPGDSPLLPLVRSVVAVPVDSLLRIEGDLQIETSNNEKVKHLYVCLSFYNGLPSQMLDFDGDKVEVNIMWYPGFDTAPPRPRGPRHPQKIVYTIGDAKSFTSLITELRDKLTKDCWKDILDGHPDPEVYYSTGDHPVLSPQRRLQPVRLLHIKLKVSNETSTTLVVRDDNLYVMGFKSQAGVWYELSSPDSVGMLREDRYKNRVLLPWDVSYRSILNCQTMKEALNILSSMELNQTFVRNAVHNLSDYHQDVTPWYEKFTRLGLAGLMVMVCESAKMNPLHHMFEYNWYRSEVHTLTTKHIGMIRNWSKMSADLRRWKDRGFAEWTCHRNLQWKDIVDNKADYTAEYVLGVIYLVRNAPRVPSGAADQGA